MTSVGGWQEIDRELRELAGERAKLDSREALLLCAAVRVAVWRKLGRATLHEYLEDVLGYSPREARERVRVAHALRDLPAIAGALAAGELRWTAVREITRIATATTQAEWLEHARGKTLREIEERVSGRKKGDRPTDPSRPEVRMRRLEIDVDPATFAKLRQVRNELANERGESVDDNALVAALCDAFLTSGAGGAGGAAANDEQPHRAKHQIMTTICEACARATQDGGGRSIAISDAELERAECDAQWIGSDREPLARATQDVSTVVARQVERRDHGKCCVPSCRASRYLEIHHVVPRHLGGSHDAENLTLLCGGHHRALHDGKLSITGLAPALEIRWLVPQGHAAERHGSALDVGREMRGDAVKALVSAGYHRRTAVAAVDAASGALVEPTLDELVRESLRCCTRTNTLSRATGHTAERHGTATETTHVGRDLRGDATEALVATGYERRTAAAAVEAASNALPEATLDQLLRESLRRCV